MLLDEYEKILFKVLNYLGAEINYDSRVTVGKDEALIKAILHIYITQNILIDKHPFS